MSKLVITIDLDWACEAVIEETLSFFKDRNIKPTIFITHRSPAVEACMNEFEVGLHPFFGEDSSHGKSITDVVKKVMDMPHNLKGFRCHRFGVCNVSKQAMVETGMLISSNTCTNLEAIRPFQDRFGLLEVPIFLEDGGYLWQKHPLVVQPSLIKAVATLLPKVILIHPMHFAINTPHFDYMRDIKLSVSRTKWNQLDKTTLDRLRWQGRGIRDFIIDLLTLVPETLSLTTLYHNALIPHNPADPSPG